MDTRWRTTFLIPIAGMALLTLLVLIVGVVFVWYGKKEVVKDTRWPVWDVAFSPDGCWLAAACGYPDDPALWGGCGAVDVWRTDRWTQEKIFAGPFTDKARGVAFTVDGKGLVAVSDRVARETRGSPFGGSQVLEWTWPEGEQVKALYVFKERYGGFVTSMAISPDNHLVALAFVGTRPLVLDEGTGRPAYEWTGYAGNSLGFAFSPDGKTLVSPYFRHPAVHLYDAASGKELASFTLEGAEPTCARFSPNGSHIAVGASDGSVRLLTADLAKQIQTLPVSDQKEPVVAIAFAPGGKRLAAATRHAVRLIDVSTDKVSQDWKEPDQDVHALAFAPNGKLLAVGCGREPEVGKKQPLGSIKLWDPATGQLVKALE